MSNISNLINERPTLFFRILIALLVVIVIAAITVGKTIINKKPDKNLEFETVQSQKNFTIENQNGKYTVETEENFYEFIDAVLEDENQFATFTAPKAIHGVRFVQICLTDGKIELQIGMEANNRTKLYYKMCSNSEVFDIFCDFFNESFVPDMTQYQPVEF